MTEELIGFELVINNAHVICALSMNVFSFGIEYYPGALVVRVGMISIGVAW